jgi:hypothetical protein
MCARRCKRPRLDPLEIHNDTLDLVGFQFYMLTGTYDDFAAEVAAIEEALKAAPDLLGVPRIEVSVPPSGVPAFDDAVLDPGDDGELVVAVDGARSYALVCTRYGPIQATVRQIAAIGPLRGDD